MKRILLAVDHTKVSMNALSYVLDMTIDDNPMIDILHVEPYILSTGDTGYDDVATHESVTQQIENLISETIKRPIAGDLALFSTRGDVVAEITDQSKVHAYDLVVVGMRDKEQILDRWIGKTALKIIDAVDVPVLVVPAGAKYDGVHQICVATDTDSITPDILDQIRNWNLPWLARMKFLHVREKSDNQFRQTASGIVSEYFEKDEVNFSFEIKVVEHDDIVEVLINEAAEGNTDMVIAVVKDRTLWNKMFHRSITKSLIRQSKIPILILHK